MKPYFLMFARYVYMMFKVVCILLKPRSWCSPEQAKVKIQNEVNWAWMKATHIWLNQVSYPRILRRIRQKVQRGEKIQVGFVVIDSAKFIKRVRTKYF